MGRAMACAAVCTTRKACLVDTDLLIDHLRRHPSAALLFDRLPQDCAISTFTVVESHAGVRDGAERVALDMLLGTFDHIDLSCEIAAQGDLLHRDWGKSHGVSLNDALIAATALRSQRVRLSLNAKHFPMLAKGAVAGALCEDIAKKSRSDALSENSIAGQHFLHLACRKVARAG